MKSLSLLFTLTLFFGLYGTHAYAAESSTIPSQETMSSEEEVYVRGLISRVSSTDMTITLRPLKGSSILLYIGPDTVLDGFQNIGELKKKQQVKVWYTAENDSKNAVKIEKMLDLGC